MNVSRYRLGDNYLKILAEGLEGQNHVNHINISRNNLTDTGMGNLLKSLTKDVKGLNLSYNRIGPDGSEHLSIFLNKQNLKYARHLSHI